MYYKITNKAAKVYQLLHQMRTNETEMEADNLKAIQEKTGLTWSSFFGQKGQQNFHRVSIYKGFKFNEIDKVDLKVWKQMRDKDNPLYFLPNTRTKAGREMQEFLNNGLEKSTFFRPLEILLGEKEIIGSFSFPFVEIVGETIVVYLDDKHEPKDENVIEITKKEFDAIRNL